MFECKICGLLSLGGSACPACGSLLLVDLAQEDGDATTLPSEVPGLDEAVASWYELEGIEPPAPQREEVAENLISGSLPFGFSGESTTHISRLPFGVGSYSGGMPFDESEEALPLISEASPTSVSEPPVTESNPLPAPAEKAPEPPVASPPPAEPVTPVENPPPALNLPPMPEMPSLPPAPALSAPQAFSPEPLRVAPVPISTAQAPQTPSSQSSFDEVPDMWRIDASPVDMEQIYAMEDQVVEVVHTSDELHESYLHTTGSDDLHPDSSVISLDLHPAKALGVQLDGLPELEDTLAEGFYAIGEESWAQAAIAFQKMAAKMPGDSAVFNNYGLALLQRALVMAKSADLEVQQLASTQFESSILALREAAKSAPTNSTILLNLSHALLVSGRAEKALTLISMYEKSHSKTQESANLEAASLVSLGESGQALKVLNMVEQDEIIRSNMSKLSY
jgi:homeobox protein ESX1